MKLPNLSTDKGTSLSEKVYIALKTAILSLSIKPKDYLYVGDIATHYGISNTPVREAMVHIENEGWIEDAGRRGKMVSIPSEDEFLELVEVQAALQGRMAWKVAEKVAEKVVNQDTIEEIKAILKETEMISSQKGERDESKKYLDHFDEFLFRVVNNEIMIEIVKEFRAKIEWVRKIYFDTGNAPVERSLNEHLVVLKAIMRGDREKAYKLMYSHATQYEEEVAKKIHSSHF